MAVPGVLACDFKYDPVSITQFYRAEGWALPGIEDNPLAPLETHGLPRFQLIPAAHQDQGKWIIDSEAACVFDVTFIDDRGDGIFRVMVHGPFPPDRVPSWARAEGD